MASSASAASSSKPRPDDRFEPDAKWKADLKKRIEENLKGMVQDAKDLLEDRLRKAPAQRESLHADFNKTMDNIRKLADDTYREELERERQERRWALGADLNPAWKESIEKEQQAILDMIKSGKGSTPPGLQTVDASDANAVSESQQSSPVPPNDDHTAQSPPSSNVARRPTVDDHPADDSGSDGESLLRPLPRRPSVRAGKQKEQDTSRLSSESPPTRSGERYSRPIPDRSPLTALPKPSPERDIPPSGRSFDRSNRSSVELHLQNSSPSPAAQYWIPPKSEDSPSQSNLHRRTSTSSRSEEPSSHHVPQRRGSTASVRSTGSTSFRPSPATIPIPETDPSIVGKAEQEKRALHEVDQQWSRLEAAREKSRDRVGSGSFEQTHTPYEYSNHSPGPGSVSSSPSQSRRPPTPPMGTKPMYRKPSFMQETTRGVDRRPSMPTLAGGPSLISASRPPDSYGMGMPPQFDNARQASPITISTYGISNTMAFATEPANYYPPYGPPTPYNADSARDPDRYFTATPSSPPGHYPMQSTPMYIPRAPPDGEEDLNSRYYHPSHGQSSYRGQGWAGPGPDAQRASYDQAWRSWTQPLGPRYSNSDLRGGQPPRAPGYHNHRNYDPGFDDLDDFEEEDLEPVYGPRSESAHWSMLEARRKEEKKRKAAEEEAQRQEEETNRKQKEEARRKEAEEQERLIKERTEKERLEKEREKERLKQERLEKERLERERLERERLERERLERERLERERLEKESIEKERIEKERREKEERERMEALEREKRLRLEEERRKKEEEARRKAEELKRREEELERKKQEAAQRKRETELRKKEEEIRRKEEEFARIQEEEMKQLREENQRREAELKRQADEAKKKEQEAKRREKEAHKKELEASKKELEAKKKEEEISQREAKLSAREEALKRRESKAEEERRRLREEEELRVRKEEEMKKAREQEEKKRAKEAEKKRVREERLRREEEKRQREEEERRLKEEEEKWRKEEEERRWREEEERQQKEEEERQLREEEERQLREEEERQLREEEERQKRQEEERRVREAEERRLKEEEQKRLRLEEELKRQREEAQRIEDDEELARKIWEEEQRRAQVDDEWSRREEDKKKSEDREAAARAFRERQEAEALKQQEKMEAQWKKMQEERKREEETRRRDEEARKKQQEPSRPSEFGWGNWSSASSAATWQQSQRSQPPAPNGTSTPNRSASNSASSAWSSSSKSSSASSAASARTSASSAASGASWATSNTSDASSSSTPTPKGRSGSTGASGASFNEAEWQRRQEEFSRQQQERFIQEQDRLERERLNRAARVMTKDDVIAMFDNHERLWQRMSTLDQLRWDHFPWPMFKKPASPEEITFAAISAYILSPHYPEKDKSRPEKDRIKEHIRRWHPDRFETKMLPKVIDTDKERVREGAGFIVRSLNDLLTKSNTRLF